VPTPQSFRSSSLLFHTLAVPAVVGRASSMDDDRRDGARDQSLRAMG
jgi:hypothetical protein